MIIIILIIIIIIIIITMVMIMIVIIIIIIIIDRNKQVLKRTLFNETRQYNIHIFNKIIFLKYRTRHIKATETNM